MLFSWRMGVGGTPKGLGLLLVYLTATTTVHADFEISNVNFGSPTTLDLTNNGGPILDQQVKAYASTQGSVLPFDDPSSVLPPETFVISLVATDLPAAGDSKEFDITTTFPEPTECGPYFLILTLTEGTGTVPYETEVFPRQVDCVEDVDLKWEFEDVGSSGQPSLELSSGSNMTASGFKVYIKNDGPTGMASRSALNAPEVMAAVVMTPSNFYLEDLFLNSNKTVQEAVDAALRSELMYLDEYLGSAIPLDGWSLTMVDTVAVTSKALASGERQEVLMTNLRSAGALPCHYNMVVLIIDPFNRTNDSNRTNNVAFGPVYIPCDYSSFTEPSLCTVIPDVESEGRNALLVRWNDNWSMGYEFKEKRGKSGFTPVEQFDFEDRINSYMAAKERASRLSALQLCSGGPIDLEASVNQSVAGRVLGLLQTIRADFMAITPSGEEATALHQKKLKLLQLADTLLTRVLEKDGPVRYIALKLLAKGIMKHVQNMMHMPGGFMLSPLMRDMGMTLSRMVDLLQRSPFSEMGGFEGGMGGPGMGGFGSGMGDYSGNYGGSEFMHRAAHKGKAPAKDLKSDMKAEGDEDKNAENLHMRVLAMLQGDDAYPARTDFPTGQPWEDRDRDWDSRSEENYENIYYDRDMPSMPMDMGPDAMDPLRMFQREMGPRGEMSPLKMMVMRIFMDLASGAPPEEMDDLSFLDLETRQLIKDVFDMAVSGDCPTEVIDAYASTYPNGTITPLEDFMAQQYRRGLSPSDVDAEFLAEVLDVIRINVSALVKQYVSPELEPYVDLSVLYLDVLKNNAEAIISTFQTIVQGVLMDPQELFLLMKMSGPEPTEEMYCFRQAQRDIALMDTEKEKGSPKSFFSNPFKDILEKDRKPCYWVEEKGGFYRGERSDVTATMYWEKIAACSCSDYDEYGQYGGDQWGSGFGSSSGWGSGWGDSGWGGSGWGSGMGNGGHWGSGMGSGGHWGSGMGSGGHWGSGMGENDWDYPSGSGDSMSEEEPISFFTGGSGGSGGGKDYADMYGRRRKRSYRVPSHRRQKMTMKTNIELLNSTVKDSEGLVTVEGQVVVKVNHRDHTSICDDGQWGADDAMVVCKSLLHEHLNHHHTVTSATATSVPRTAKTPVTRISELKCTGKEKDILSCRLTKDRRCKVKEVAGVKCVLK